ncbi:MAG: sugar ABC transporter ATP-binding protein [Armatimonadetes bacterium]|nr:sugar ABC transporter ATP-binding protein [Armatimonadota bacterium]
MPEVIHSPSVTPADNQTSVLEMRSISKAFPGVRALDGVDFEVKRGEVHALVGENGAGKSTLMKILAGAQSADSGEILLDGEAATIDSPQKAMDLGISIIYQEFNLVPYLSAAENIFLGREPRAAIPGFVDFRTMHAQAQSLIDDLGVKLDIRETVNRLSVAQQQMVEIAKATSRQARIIAMDEPSATLTDYELAHLFALIERLKSQGVAIVYISHRLEEIFQIADRVTVFRDGHVVGTRPVGELDRETVIQMMVGREIKQQIPKEAATPGEVVLELKNVSRAGVLNNISFAVRAGEIVGLAGLVGAGRTEVARVIFGADSYDSGEILLDGQPLRVKNPRDAIGAGVGLVTEDRKALGLILGMAVRENITLANLAEVSRLSFINQRKEKQVARQYVDDLAIKTPSVEQQVQNLSGGNQQKVVLAKWLFTQSRVLIFDEPTRGIDVGSKVEIYQLMNRLAANGTAIIMISSELPEVLGMSDRIVVMHEGSVAGELSRSEATQEKIMHLATGGQ